MISEGAHVTGSPVLLRTSLASPEKMMEDLGNLQEGDLRHSQGFLFCYQ